MAIPETLGERLRAARKRKGVGQDEVARAVGVHVKTVSRWENDRQTPEEEELRTLARYLGDSPARLRYGENGAGGATSEGTADEGFVPNPRYREMVPPRAYAVALGYLERLRAAGVRRDDLEEAERVLLDSAFSKLYKRERGELSEEDHILLIDAGWEIVREVMSWQGIRP